MVVFAKTLKETTLSIRAKVSSKKAINSEQF